MVSLTRSINTNAGGATFFSESTMDDGETLLQPYSVAYGTFKPLRTATIFCVHLLCTFGLCVTSIVFASVKRHTDCQEYFFIIYAHTGLWFLTLMIDQFARIEHNVLRINGYLEFFKKTEVHHKLPFYIVSLISWSLLFIQALMQHYYSTNFEDKCTNGGAKSPIIYLCLFITLEFLMVLVIETSYIVKVKKFNSQKLPPDVQKEEWNMSSVPQTFVQEEVGYQHPGDRLYDFLEKQADLIRHLKDHNARLGEKLMMLNAQMQATSRNEQ